MKMVVQNDVGEKCHVILIFEFEQQIVEQVFGPAGFKKKVAVVALPNHVKKGIFKKHVLAGDSGHGPKESNFRANL